jgi:NhaP-type Na+/H+ or K+/H+ antiporter
MRAVSWIILGTFVGVLLVGLISFLSIDRYNAAEMALTLGKLTGLTQLMGFFLAAIAGLLLLMMGAGSDISVERAAVLTLALFAGLMLIGSNWGLAVGTAAVIVALLWRHGDSKERRTTNTPAQPAPSPPTLAFPVDRPNG